MGGNGKIQRNSPLARRQTSFLFVLSLGTEGTWQEASDDEARLISQLALPRQSGDLRGSFTPEIFSEWFASIGRHGA
jgi:hypothetical protein